MAGILIKKYENRRLYNTQEKKYISLNDVRELVLQNIEFTVVEQKTKKDITSQVLFQVILETEGDKLSSFPGFFLRFLITSPSSVIKDYFGTFFSSQVKMYMNNREKYLDMLSNMSGKMFGGMEPKWVNPFQSFFNPFGSSDTSQDMKETSPPEDEEPSVPEENSDDTSDDSAEDDIKELQQMMKMLSKRLENIEKKKK